MTGLDPTTLYFVLTALLANFLNGFNGSANSVATMIASRAMHPRQALLLSAAAHFCGPFLSGAAVAVTMGSGVVQEEATRLPVIWAALLATIAWSLVSSQLGIPSSYSHALIGGLVGAAVAGYGIEALQARGLLRIVLILFTSPLLGLIVGYGMQKLIFFLCRGATPRINTFFRKSQGFTATALALSHGANDAQKTVGLITVGLLAQGALPAFRSPPWVVMACAATIALGTAVGGWSVIRTLGRKFYKVRPVHSFTSHLASAAIVFGAGALGGPVSTSQIVSTTILGVGAAERMNMVRWGVMKQIMVTWLITMPAVAVMAALFYWLLV